MSIFDIKRFLGLPVLASKHGADVDNLIVWIHWLMLGLFVGWMAYFLFVIFRFRKSANPKANYHGVKNHFSTYVEVGVAVIEAFLLIGLAIPLWRGVVDKFPDAKESTVIRVTAEQFSWNARYPGKDGEFGKQDLKFVAGDNKFGYDPNDAAGKDDLTPPTKDIRVPVDKPVIIYLSSLDVIHSFAVRPMRVTQDAIPGMRFAMHFTPTKEGHYLITCAQLCGIGHSTMNGFFTVLSAADYDKWQADLAKSGGGGGGFE